MYVFLFISKKWRLIFLVDVLVAAVGVYVCMCVLKTIFVCYFYLFILFYFVWLRVVLFYDVVDDDVKNKSFCCYYCWRLCCYCMSIVVPTNN